MGKQGVAYKIIQLTVQSRTVHWLFTQLWAHRLTDDWTGKPCTVVRIKGWRKALVRTPGGNRYTVEWL